MKTVLHPSAEPNKGFQKSFTLLWESIKKPFSKPSFHSLPRPPKSLCLVCLWCKWSLERVQSLRPIWDTMTEPTWVHGLSASPRHPSQHGRWCSSPEERKEPEACVRTLYSIYRVTAWCHQMCLNTACGENLIEHLITLSSLTSKQ